MSNIRDLGDRSNCKSVQVISSGLDGRALAHAQAFTVGVGFPQLHRKIEAACVKGQRERGASLAPEPHLICKVWRHILDAGVFSANRRIRPLYAKKSRAARTTSELLSTANTLKVSPHRITCF